MKDLRYIDTHCHLNLDPLYSDRESIIQQMNELSVGGIIVGTNAESSRRACEIASQHDNLWATIGLHPIEVEEDSWEGELDIIENLYDEYPGVIVGIGECGYDYFHREQGVFGAAQTDAFARQIEFAAARELPLMLHMRSRAATSTAAYDDALMVLSKYKKKYPQLRMNAHFYAGSVEHAQAFFDLGGTVSFTGVITFVQSFQELIKKIPIEKIMCETDAPYVSPEPHRGTTCLPQYVSHVYDEIVDIKIPGGEEDNGEKRNELREQLVQNAIEFWKLK